MKINYELFCKIMLVLLIIVFIAEGLNWIFKCNFNHHLFHIFWVLFSFNMGIYIGKRCVNYEEDN